MCFDTIAVNTGRFNGAAAILEHHILEIILRDVFEVIMNLSTKSPNVALFDHFKKNWNNIYKSNFDASIDDEKVTKFINAQMADKIKQRMLKIICWFRSSL